MSSFEFSTWSEANPDAAAVYAGNPPKSWRAVGGTISKLLLHLDAIIGTNEPAVCVKAVLLRVIAHSDCLAAARVESDITADRWFSSINQLAAQLVVDMPAKLHAIALAAGGGGTGADQGRKRPGKPARQSDKVPYLRSNSVGAKAIAQVIASDRRYTGISVDQLRLTALLIHADVVDGHLRNDLPAADNLHVADNKTARQANRKLRSLPPDTADPVAELTDVVRRAVVTRSAQAREIWLTAIEKHGERRDYFGLMSRTNTFANPSAMVKNDVVVLAYTPHAADAKGKMVPLTFGAMTSHPGFEPLAWGRKKRDNISEELTDAAMALLRHPSFAKKPATLAVEVQLFLNQFLQLKKQQHAIRKVGWARNVMSLTKMCAKYATSRAMSIKAYQIDHTDVTLGTIIGTGAGGEVWRGTMGDAIVAVKKISESYRELKADVGTFGIVSVHEDLEREVAALTEMRHPNLVKFLGTGLFEDETRFIVLEFMAKGSLRDLLDDMDQEIPWTCRMQICYDGAAGMAYIHSLGHVHRDVKSPNLLISQNNSCKIADFGQISHVGAVGQDLAGTSLWLSPELVPSNVPGFDNRKPAKSSDVYSWAIVMWEVSTRKYPWHEMNQVLGVYEAVRAGKRPAVDQALMFKESTKRFADLMKRCWSQDPDARPTFHEILEDLTAAERSQLTVKPRHFGGGDGETRGARQPGPMLMERVIRPR